MKARPRIPQFVMGFVLAVLLVVPFFIQPMPARAASNVSENDAAARYKNCLSDIDRDAKKAFDEATNWAELDGGLPARHCQAAALMALGQYKEAAARLEKIASEKNISTSMRTGLLKQAATAWGQAGNLKQGDAVLTTALKLLPNDVGLLLDRAQVRALREDYPGALYDLNKAVRLSPANSDAYAFRASTYRLMENFTAARKDANTSLRYDPDNLSALLERGILKRLDKDNEGARKDWIRLIEAAPASSEAEMARKNIAAMDMKK